MSDNQREMKEEQEVEEFQQQVEEQEDQGTQNDITNEPQENDDVPPEEPVTKRDDEDDDNVSDDIDEDELNDLNDGNDYDEEDDNVYSLKAHKSKNSNATRKKNVRRSNRDDEPLTTMMGNENQQIDEENGIDYSNEDPASRKRRLLEEKMDLAIKNKGLKRKKADEDDLERMQDDKIDYLKQKMIQAASIDEEKSEKGLIATEKLKLLDEVVSVMSQADLAISILDNNLLDAVRLWLEPLPNASMPAYQIQKQLIQSLVDLPIKTDHLVASGIGKVMVFYQRSKRVELNLKKIVDQLIGDWTRPILNKSDSYKDRTIQFQDYNKGKFVNKLSSSRPKVKAEPKTLYEESAERRNRAAIPSARTSAYKIAPKVNTDLLNRRRNMGGNDERFKRINQKINSKKKATGKKNGPSIEGRNLPM